MTSITSISLGSDAPAAARAFYDAAFDLGDRLEVHEAAAPTTGFRGFVVSLLVSQPSGVAALLDSATAAGGSTIKPIDRSLWGVGGVVQAPDGAIWKIATSVKKDSAPATREILRVVVLVAAGDVAASKAFYSGRGLTVAKSFGKYVEFALPGSDIGFGLYSRKALAKDAGVAPLGSGSHRMALVGDAGAFTDPDGFEWEAQRAPASRP